MKMRVMKMKILGVSRVPLHSGRCATHVSIQLITTRPLTMLHRLKVCPDFPQSTLSVRAVKLETPMRKRIKAMAMVMRCVRMPNALCRPRVRKPTMRKTMISE